MDLHIERIIAKLTTPLKLLICRFLYHSSKITFGSKVLVYGGLKVRGKKGTIEIGDMCTIRRLNINFIDSGNSGLLKLNRECTIEHGVTLAPRSGSIIIEKNVFLGQNVLVQSFDNARVCIGEGTLIAKDCNILASDHDLNDVQGGYRKEVGKSILLGRNVWLGAGVVVLPGVIIGDCAVLGAGSIVTGDLPAYSLSVGNPARVIKTFNRANMKWEKVC